MTHKQVLIVRKDLKMKSGKIGSQTAHASVGALLSVPNFQQDPRVKPWLEHSFTKICLSAPGEEDLLRLEAAAKQAGLITCLITDNGTTVFKGIPTKTVLAIGPDEISKIDSITRDLQLLT